MDYVSIGMSLNSFCILKKGISFTTSALFRLQLASPRSLPLGGHRDLVCSYRAALKWELAILLENSTHLVMLVISPHRN